MKENFLKNVQLYPSDTFKIVIDNLTRQLFDMCIASGDKIGVELLESNVKHVKSKITISNISALKVQFGEFDWAVLDAITSERIENSDDYTTAAIICRKLGASHTPTKELQAAVVDTLEKFAVIRITANMEDTKKFYDTTTKDGSYTFRGYLLPTESLEMSVNGQEATLIHFLRRGVIWGVAEMKDQIITCSAELFQPPIRMTPRSIAITHFLLRRILEMKGTLEASKSNKRVKPLRHTILFDSLYDACDIVGNIAKQHARSIATDILTCFVEKNFIKGYSFEKGKAGKTRAINVDF